MKQNIISALRWIAILPCAVASYFLGYALYKFLFWVSDYLNQEENGWFKEYLTFIISGGVAGYAFVFISSQLAPVHKKNVALILLVLLAMCMGIGVFAGILEKHTLSILEATSGVIGGVIGYFNVITEEEEKK